MIESAFLKVATEYCIYPNQIIAYILRQIPTMVLRDIFIFLSNIYMTCPRSHCIECIECAAPHFPQFIEILRTNSIATRRIELKSVSGELLF